MSVAPFPRRSGFGDATSDNAAYQAAKTALQAATQYPEIYQVQTSGGTSDNPGPFNSYWNLSNTLAGIDAGTYTLAAQAQGLRDWTYLVRQYMPGQPAQPTAQPAQPTAIINPPVTSPIGATVGPSGTVTVGHVVPPTPTTTAPASSSPGLLQSLEDQFSGLFTSLAAQTGLSVHTLEIAAVLLVIGGLYMFSGKPHR